MNTFAGLDLEHRFGAASMGKRIQPAADSEAATDTSFGQRLAAFRKAAGFTQVELAAALEVSQRMVAYYESPGATPPAHLLPHIATALGVTIDALYGQAPQPKQLAKQEGDSRLRRRLLAIEKLETNDKRQVLQLIDAFIERGQLKRKVASQTQA
jgi:transcriptional regulator with XRE-family HTH domain